MAETLTEDPFVAWEATFEGGNTANTWKMPADRGGGRGCRADARST